jgi:8-oxo-dGTP diphosphatase
VRDHGPVIDAAGGVVWRIGKRGQVEVLLIRTRRGGEWELPKGKRKRSETLAECARREVHEETGMTCALGAVLGGTRYRDRRGRAKTVTWWAMQPIAGRFRPGREADRGMWVDAAAAGEWLAKPRDAAVVAALPQPLMRALAGS